MNADHKQTLHKRLRRGREAVLWKIDGVSEYDVRRPLTRTGTNLLGLVKHLAIGEATYFGDCFGRPFEPHLPWWDDDAEEGADMWADAGESRESIVATYRAATAHADATIEALTLDAPGRVHWWSTPEVTLQEVLVHMLADNFRHAGHMDVLREQIDGSVGLDPRVSNVPERSDQWWAAYRQRIEDAARRYDA